jgi:acetyl esterase/lipase
MNLKLVAFLSMTFLSILFSSNAQTQKIQIWPHGVPGEIKNDQYKESNNNPNNSIGCISKITNPEISVYLPSKEKATGTAVLICPGGGYGVVCMEHEGVAVAKWFNEIGIAAIVLKYRLPSDLIMKDKTVGPLQDAQEAMRIIRKNAEKWGINKDKIGVLGFSAGGHLASTLSTHYNDKIYEAGNISARPDFSILIYPVITFDESFGHMGSRKNLIGESPSEEKIKFYSNELQVNKETPQAFLVHSADDMTVPVKNSLRYFEELRKNGVSAEMHVYEKGGHGYGLGRDPKSSESSWTKACEAWLKSKSLIQ